VATGYLFETTFLPSFLPSVLPKVGTGHSVLWVLNLFTSRINWMPVYAFQDTPLPSPMKLVTSVEITDLIK
jgi:hypothetical protein